MNDSLSTAGRGAIVLFGLAAWLLWPAASPGALNALDLFAGGDRLLTRDTATGLDWLDLTATMNLSARDISTGVGGWQLRGFVYATIAQVRTLFLDSDPPNVVINSGANPTSPNNVPGAQLLLNLVGITHPGPSTNEFDIVGNGIAGVGEPGPGLVHLADYGTSTDGTLGFFFVPDGTVADTFRDAQVGNFLVRPVTVPEPSGLLLFAVGVLVHRVGRRERPQPRNRSMR